jgi:hypothetical protein
VAFPYKGRPRPYAILGHNPTPGTDVTSHLKSIYGHDDALVALWLTVKEFPAHPDDQMWSPLSLEYDSSHSTVPSAWWLKTKGDIHMDMFSPMKNYQQVKKRQMVQDWNIINSHIPLPPFLFTITDSMKTKTCVNLHTIKKHKRTDIFIHTHFIWNPCF